MMSLTEPIVHATKRAFGHDALVVGPGIKTGMPILIDNPVEVAVAPAPSAEPSERAPASSPPFARRVSSTRRGVTKARWLANADV